MTMFPKKLAIIGFLVSIIFFTVGMAGWKKESKTPLDAFSSYPVDSVLSLRPLSPLSPSTEDAPSSAIPQSSIASPASLGTAVVPIVSSPTQSAKIPKPQTPQPVRLNECSLSLSISPQGGGKYKIGILNNGTVCLNASLSLYYPEGMSFLSSAPASSADGYYWMFGNIPSGDYKEVALETKGSGILEGCLSADNGSDACSYGENPADSQIASKSAVAEAVSSGNIVTASKGATEYGSWVWEKLSQMSPSYKERVINAAVSEGIDTLYITVDDYLDIDSLPEGAGKELMKKKYEDSLESFVRSANASGITVEAEAGWRDWAEPENRHKGFAIIDFLKSYNASHNAKIRSLQYDVEPYLLPGYESDKAPYLSNFVEFIDQSAKRLGSSDLGFTVVLPHFFDGQKNWTPAVSFSEVTAHTYEHVLRILDSRQGSRIIIMAYRNNASGSDGSVSLAKTEVNEASEGNHRTKVIVAGEAGNVEPAFVTFFSHSKKYYEEQLGLVRGAFSGERNFGGTAIHYIDPFLELK